MIPVPDLLSLEPRLDVDRTQLHELLGLAFTGRGDAAAIDQALAEIPEAGCYGVESHGAEIDSSARGWRGEHFAGDLFVRELIEEHLAVRHESKRYSPNTRFLFRVLCQPPADFETVRFRQEILAELWNDPGIYSKALGLYLRLYDLINMFKIPGQAARLDINSFRLDLFRLVKEAIDSMVSDFETATSGLRRLHLVGREIRASEEYHIVEALLGYAEERATLGVSLKVGATGKITHFEITGVRHNRENPFYLSPARRWLTKLKSVLWYGFRLHDETILNRLVQGIYERLATPIMGLGQVLGHLEVYLTQHQHRQRVEEEGHTVCLADVTERGPLVLERLYNPLLLGQPAPPVPCDLRQIEARSMTLVTGPNSGGKTRLLQALGLAQLLGQGGFYVHAREARLVRVHGLFVSLIEHEAVDHQEGRLGRELERIRAMFEAMRTPSMVILDELCSGTNPSEGTEVFSLVLRLLEKVRPVGFITTHFLDYARGLEAEPPIEGLRFLQVEIDDVQRSTYQFLPGVAETSLAALMAERMGVTFDAISAALETASNGGTEAGQAGDSVGESG
ncbi:MAG: hypothetical protein MI919_17985 [Holophagales bacterium]|nr:hypothetical protein [Holophagales bacterium]